MFERLKSLSKLRESFYLIINSASVNTCDLQCHRSRRQQASVNYLKCTVPVLSGRVSKKAQLLFSKDRVSNFTTIRLFDSRHGLEISSSTESRPSWGPFNVLFGVCWVRFFQWLNRTKRKAYHSLLNSFKVNNEWKYTPHPSHTILTCTETVLQFCELTVSDRVANATEPGCKIYVPINYS
jgi:hypothetical protein